MKTSVNGVCSVLIMLVTSRLSACATTSFNITTTRVLGPFEGISVSGGLQTLFSMNSREGAALGKTSFSPITIAAPHSESDLTLINALVAAKTLEQVDIGFYGASYLERKQIYRKITLGRALITSYKSTTDENGPVTVFTVLFEKYTDTTYPRSPNGSITRPITTTYEINSGKPATNSR